MNLKQLLFMMLGIGMLTACVNEAVTISFGESVSLKEAMEKLPEDVYVRGVTVEFEPERTGTLALKEPTQSADEIVNQSITAKNNLTPALIRMLSVKSSLSDSPEWEEFNRLTQEEVDKLKALNEEPVDAESMLINDIIVDGPLLSLGAYSKAMNGSVSRL